MEYVSLCHMLCRTLWFFNIEVLSRIDKELPADGNITADGPFVSSSGGLCGSHAHHRYSALLWSCRWLPSVPSLSVSSGAHCECICSFIMRFICHCRAWKPSLWHPVPLMKHLGLHLQRAHVPSISVIERCCFILLCVPGRQLKLHLLQPGPSVHHLASTFFHTQPIWRAAEPRSRAILPWFEHICLVLPVLLCPGLDLGSVPGWDCSRSAGEWC